MPPLPGEERLATLFADVHYYFDQPRPRPYRHRFDKASYFYIYYNSTRHTSRIEIANNPGTSAQDACNGYLDKCRVTNSFKFPTLVTMEVDVDEISTSPTSPISRDPDEWRLPSGDNNDQHSRHKLHTLDIYFWTQEDARLATQFFQKLLAPSQLDIHGIGSQATQHTGNMSPVVQNLENVAISDPAYRNGQTRDSQNKPQVVVLPPPPPPPPSTNPPRNHTPAYSQTKSETSHSDRTASPVSKPQNSSFTSVPAYNPAAPAAPEPRAHREKTPPPDDEAGGTGLNATAMHDNTYQPSYSTIQSQTTTAGTNHSQFGHYGSPPPPTKSGYGQPPPIGYTSPSPQQHSNRSSTTFNASSFAPPPPSTIPSYGSQPSSVGYGSPSPQQQGSRSSASSQIPSFAPPPPQGQQSQELQRHSSAAQNYTPDTFSHHQSVETPGTEFYRTLEQPARPLQHIHPQYPDVLASKTTSPPPGGGHQQYSYGQAGAQGHHGHSNRPSDDPYAIHSSVYRPEAEADPHRRKSSRTESRPSTTSKIDATADKYLGKFKKRFG